MHFPVLGKVIGSPQTSEDQERPAADLGRRRWKAWDRVGQGPNPISTAGALGQLVLLSGLVAREAAASTSAGRSIVPLALGLGTRQDRRGTYRAHITILQ